MTDPQDDAGGEQEVLSSLPRSRPHRRSEKRSAGTAAARTKAAKPREPVTRAKPASRKPIRPPAAGEPIRPPAPPRPASKPIEPSRELGATELLTTAVQAAGELAQIGLSFGTRLLRDTVARLPRP